MEPFYVSSPLQSWSGFEFHIRISNPDQGVTILIKTLFSIFSVGMGMTMTGLNPNGFPQPQSIAPAPAMGIMAMMAAAAPQPAALTVGQTVTPQSMVDTVPAGSSLESGGCRRRESSSPSVSLINIGGAAVASASTAAASNAMTAAVATASSKLSNETLGTATGQSQSHSPRLHSSRRRSKTSINSGTAAESESLVNNPAAVPTSTSNSLNTAAPCPPASLRRPSFERTLY